MVEVLKEWATKDGVVWNRWVDGRVTVFRLDDRFVQPLRTTLVPPADLVWHPGAHVPAAPA